MGLEKVILIAGLPGVGVGRLLDFIRGGLLPSLERDGLDSGVVVSSFERHLRRAYGMASIEKIALLLLSSSREMVLGKFRAALSDVKKEAEGKRVLVMGIHLSYFTRGLIAPNPILPEIASLAPRVYVLYLVEDYYDALARIAEKMVSRVLGRDGLYVEKYTLDPLTYLMWRGAEFNILNMMISSSGGRVKAFVLGVKHRRETLLRILRMLITGERLLQVYFSHPISIFRELRRLGDPGLSFSEIPGVDAIEAVKDALIESSGDLILYEPTSIDELILTSKGDACRKLGGTSEEAPQDAGFTIDPVISPGNRWPVPRDTLMNDYPYTQGGSRSLADDSLFKELFGPMLRELRVEACSRELSYLGDMLSQLIISQIEVRDYAYVEQSDAVLVSIPLFYRVEASQDGYADVEVYAHIASGVDAEIRRAHALAKRVAVIFIPVSIKRLASKLCGGGCVDRVVELIASRSHPPLRRRIIMARECLDPIAEADAAGPGVGGECAEYYENLKSVFDELAVSLTRGMGIRRPLGPLSAADGALTVYNVRESTVNLSHLLRGFEEHG